MGAESSHDETPPRARALAILRAALLALVLTAASPAVTHTYWAPKAAALLLLAPAGILALVRQRRHLDVRVGLLWLLAGAVASAASTRPMLALVGPINQGNGLLFFLIALGLYAYAREASAYERRLIAWAVGGACAANAIVALLQVHDLLPLERLDADGRMFGLLGNAVHLGSLGAAVVAFCAWQPSTRALLPRAAAVATAAVVIQVSGGRIAIAIALAAALAALGRYRDRGRLALVAAAVAGLALAPIVAGESSLASSRAAASSGSAIDQQAGSVGGTALRLAVWRSGLSAFADRPLLGWGPGRFEEAATPHYDEAAATAIWRDYGADNAYTDAHNVVVDMLVAFGAIGTALFLGWLATAMRSSGGPYLAMAVALLAAWCFQPTNVAITTLLFVALGLACPARKRWEASRIERLAVPLAIATAVAAGSLVAGEVLLERGRADADPEAVATASALLPPWPDIALARSDALAFQALSAKAVRPAAVAAARRSTRLDPAATAALYRYGVLETIWGDPGRGRAAIDEAIRLRPYFVAARRTRAALAAERGDTAGRERDCRIVRAVTGSPQCFPSTPLTSRATLDSSPLTNRPDESVE